MTDECYTHDGVDYRGRVNVTEDGQECVPWTFMGLSDDSLDGHAYCRNPDGKKRPWCFTHRRLRTWGYCTMIAPASETRCDKSLPIAQCAPRCSPDLLRNDRCDEECNVASCNFDMKRCKESECYSDVRGRDYRGTMFTTRSGRVCQNWKVTYPHYHMYDTVVDVGIGNHNFCRNPDNFSAPWCFTTDFSVRWEVCSQVRLFRRENCSAPLCSRKCANVVGNGRCDAECDMYDCLWDGGDCEDILLQLGARFGFDGTHLHLQRRSAEAFFRLHPFGIAFAFVGVGIGMGLAVQLLILLRRRRARRLRMGAYDDGSHGPFGHDNIASCPTT